jgi:hypothetical protein
VTKMSTREMQSGRKGLPTMGLPTMSLPLKTIGKRPGKKIRRTDRTVLAVVATRSWAMNKKLLQKIRAETKMIPKRVRRTRLVILQHPLHTYSTIIPSNPSHPAWDGVTDSDMMLLPPADPVKIKKEPENDLDTGSFPPLINSNPRHSDVQPYDPLGSVYLDGREKPEQ